VELLEGEILWEAGKVLVHRRVRLLAAQARVYLLVDRPRTDDAIDEPDRRAVGKRLQLGDSEAHPCAQLFEHERVGQRRGPLEGAECSLEPAFPAVRPGERAGRVMLGWGKRRDRPQSLALRRGLLDRPGESR